jgi:hypothetical protein
MAHRAVRGYLDAFPTTATRALSWNVVVLDKGSRVCDLFQVDDVADRRNSGELSPFS